MFNPVVLPLPLAVAVLAALAAALMAGRPRPGRTATRRPVGRHRLGIADNPYRPSRRPADRRPLVGADVSARVEETRGRDGNGMWSWSDANWAGDSRELAAAR